MGTQASDSNSRWQMASSPTSPRRRFHGQIASAVRERPPGTGNSGQIGIEGFVQGDGIEIPTDVNACLEENAVRERKCAIQSSAPHRSTRIQRPLEGGGRGPSGWRQAPSTTFGIDYQ